MSVIKGISASKGIIKGISYFYRPRELDFSEMAEGSAEDERKRFLAACEIAAKQLSVLQMQVKESVGDAESKIFEAQEMMILSPDFTDCVELLINEGKTAEYAVKNGSKDLENILLETDDAYMTERVSDVRDIAERVMRVMLNIDMEPELPDYSHILFAEDLMPSQTIKMNTSLILGIVTSKGAYTSHTAILARTLGIPAVVGTGSAIYAIQSGQEVILDGGEGTLLTNFSEEDLLEYEKKRKEYINHKNIFTQMKGLTSTTLDGTQIHICANIGRPDDVDQALENDADGIGLFRTEFLYMESNEFPSEDKQFEAYRRTLQAMKGKRVIIRTFDIGADKALPYINLGCEDNPAMGCRAIRVCLQHKDLFKTQLRALLRASVYGKLAIMFPMISKLEELHICKETLEECKSELRDKRKPYSDNIEVGIMVEVPAAAVMSDVLAKEVDFFSIGTNDLSQFTMAADRTNSKVNSLCDANSEAVLRLMHFTAENAVKNGIFCGVCGELAGNVSYVERLVRMGVRELSMTPSTILEVRKLIRKLDLSK